MILNIKHEYDCSFKENTVNLKTSMLQFKSTHLFIASNCWEQINLDIEDDIPEGYLNHFHTLCNDIRVSIPDKITDKTVILLTELYPDKSGKIRKAYMQGTDMRRCLEDCMVK